MYKTNHALAMPFPLSRWHPSLSFPAPSSLPLPFFSPCFGLWLSPGVAGCFTFLRAVEDFEPCELPAFRARFLGFLAFAQAVPFNDYRSVTHPLCMRVNLCMRRLGSLKTR